ncbi:MAG: hypothetical protein FWC40_09700 [Proteobacteria bacterium]|nr:hypothetical protein [Pseudomonadota bacterium]
MKSLKNVFLRGVPAFLLAVCLVAAGVVASTVEPTAAMAQDTDRITMDFVGFGFNPDFYAVVQSSRLAGQSLVIYKIGGQGPTLVYPLAGTSLQKALTSREVAPYGIQANHVAGMTAPAGFQLGGMIIGENLQLTLSAGDQSMTLGYATIFGTPRKDKFAQISIKNAFWTPDSRRVVIVLNQKLDGDWPVDTDMVASYALN